jgi:hypothetical protein
MMTTTIVRAPHWAGYFQSLGRETERRLATGHVDRDGFADLAAAVLREVPPPADFDWTTLLQDVVAGRELLPAQEDPGATFGEPPLTLFRSDEFFVSALYWLDGTTSIHQHSFSGAFRVLGGSSLHVPYDFEPRDFVSDHLTLGALDMHAPEILRCGDTRTIQYGDALIHSLFHLHRPSVTVVIRTYSDRSAQPNYLQPGIAFDAFLSDTLMARRFQSLLTLRAIDPAAAWRAAKGFVEDADLWDGFQLLMKWAQQVDHGETLTDLLAVMQRRHGEVVQDLQTAVVEVVRSFAIVLRRRMVHDPEQRLFLALLLNLRNVASIEAVLRQIYPQRQPGDVLAEWVAELTHPRNCETLGISLTASAAGKLADALRACDREALRTISDSERLPRMFSPLLA